jgi:hypothetical protein
MLICITCLRQPPSPPLAILLGPLPVQWGGAFLFSSARLRTLHEKIALELLAKNGISSIWLLHLKAARAYRTAIRAPLRS